MKETGCISQQIIHAAPYEGIDKLETKLVTKINNKYNLLKLDYQWFTSSNTNLVRLVQPVLRVQENAKRVSLQLNIAQN